MPPTSKRKKDQKIGTSPVGQNKSRKVRNSRNREERNAARERIREMEDVVSNIQERNTQLDAENTLLRNQLLVIQRRLEQEREAREELKRIQNQAQAQQPPALQQPPPIDHIVQERYNRMAAQLTCSLCLSIVKIPCAMQCGHLFCRDCLRHFYNRPAPGGLILQKYRKCPTCQVKSFYYTKVWQLEEVMAVLGELNPVLIADPNQQENREPPPAAEIQNNERVQIVNHQIAARNDEAFLQERRRIFVNRIIGRNEHPAPVDPRELAPVLEQMEEDDIFERRDDIPELANEGAPINEPIDDDNGQNQPRQLPNILPVYNRQVAALQQRIQQRLAALQQQAVAIAARQPQQPNYQAMPQNYLVVPPFGNGVVEYGQVGVGIQNQQFAPFQRLADQVGANPAGNLPAFLGLVNHPPGVNPPPQYNNYNNYAFYNQNGQPVVNQVPQDQLRDDVLLQNDEQNERNRVNQPGLTVEMRNGEIQITINNTQLRGPQNEEENDEFREALNILELEIEQRLGDARQDHRENAVRLDILTNKIRTNDQQLQKLEQQKRNIRSLKNCLLLMRFPFAEEPQNPRRGEYLPAQFIRDLVHAFGFTDGDALPENIVDRLLNRNQPPNYGLQQNLYYNNYHPFYFNYNFNPPYMGYAAY